MPKTILTVDDKENVRTLIREYLTEEGFRVVTAENGQTALFVARQEKPDLILLDLMMPEMDGTSFIRAFRRESDTPIIVLTAKLEESDKVLGLELGADDYMTKPFNPRELMARIKAILRRREPNGQRPSESADSAVVRVQQLVVDPARRETRVAGREVRLRAKEFDLLLTLLEHKGIVLTREKLLEIVWGFDFAGETRTVDVHVAQLRKHIAGSGVEIETVFGVGYKLRV